MKTPFLSLIAVSGVALTGLAQDLSIPSGRALPTPESRKMLTVEPNERNPFGLVEITAKTVATDMMQSEEERIKATLVNLPVRGHSMSERGASVVLGPLALREGDELPAIFPGQLERLKLSKVSDKTLVFTFIERDASVPERSFSINFSVAPRVSYALPVDVMNASGGKTHFPLRGRYAHERDPLQD